MAKQHTFPGLMEAVARFVEEHNYDKPQIIDDYTSRDDTSQVAYREISVAVLSDIYVFRQWRFGNDYGDVCREVVTARQIRIYSEFLVQKSPRQTEGTEDEHKFIVSSIEN